MKDSKKKPIPLNQVKGKDMFSQIKQWHQNLKEVIQERNELAERLAALAVENLRLTHEVAQLKEENAQAWEAAVSRNIQSQNGQHLEMENKRLRAMLIAQESQLKAYEIARPFKMYG